MREMVRPFKVLFNERRRKLADWVQVVLAVQWALNAADRERYQACPFKKGAWARARDAVHDAAGE